MCTEGYSIVFKHFWGKLFPGILHVTSTNLIRSNLLSESISSSKFRMCEFHLCRLAHMLLQKWSNCKGLAHLWDFDLKVYKRLKVVFELIRKCFYSPSWKKRKKKCFYPHTSSVICCFSWFQDFNSGITFLNRNMQVHQWCCATLYRFVLFLFCSWLE